MEITTEEIESLIVVAVNELLFTFKEQNKMFTVTDTNLALVNNIIVSVFNNLIAEGQIPPVNEMKMPEAYFTDAKFSLHRSAMIEVASNGCGEILVLPKISDDYLWSA